MPLPRTAHRDPPNPRLPRPRAMRTDAEATVGPPGTRQLSLSVVIPTDGDGERLADCLAALATAPRRGIDLEILVVAAGDSAEVRAATEAAGAALLPTAGTRGSRFAAGAKAATGEWLLLLRPDTVLDRGWDATLVVYAHADHNRERAAVYTYRAAGDHEHTVRRSERAVAMRNRWLALPSGAQGLVIRRRFLAHLGGVPDLERGEDLVLARRLGRSRLAMFDVAARTPPPTGRGAGLAAALRLLLFVLRVPPRWLQWLGD